MEHLKLQRLQILHVDDEFPLDVVKISGIFPQISAYTITNRLEMSLAKQYFETERIVIAHLLP